MSSRCKMMISIFAKDLKPVNTSTMTLADEKNVEKFDLLEIKISMLQKSLIEQV